MVRVHDGPSRERPSAMALALVPLGVAFAFGILLLPRAPLPDSVPLPIADSRGLERAASNDEALAARARSETLPATVRALGSALRTFHEEEARGASVLALGEARRGVDSALVGALAEGDDALLRLRAANLSTFLAELRRFESTGVESDELRAVGGAFVRTMRSEGWMSGTRLLAERPVLAAMFKQMWNGFVGLDARTPFGLTIDEFRALYAFYLLRPHPAQAMRDAIAAARRGARDAAACTAIDEAERVAVEAWRIERIDRLAARDALYPAAYARGVANLRRGDYHAAADDFRNWLRDHPDGSLTLRAQNYLRTAVGGERLQ